MSDMRLDGCAHNEPSRACCAAVLLASVFVSASSVAESPGGPGDPPVYRPLSPEEVAAAERTQPHRMEGTGDERPPVPPSQGQPQSYGPVYGAGLPPLPEPVPAPIESENGLAMARQAYWRQEYAAAEARYQRLMEQRPGDPNPAGELGNIYYAQGRWRDAAGAYRKAALNLARLSRFGQAMHMAAIVGGLDVQGGQTLAREIDSIRTSRP